MTLFTLKLYSCLRVSRIEESYYTQSNKRKSVNIHKRISGKVSQATLKWFYFMPHRCDMYPKTPSKCKSPYNSFVYTCQKCVFLHHTGVHVNILCQLGYLEVWAWRSTADLCIAHTKLIGFLLDFTVRMLSLCYNAVNAVYGYVTVGCRIVHL